MQFTLPINIQAQPSDSTCGPTCLHAIYDFLGGTQTVSEIIAQIPQLETGGTLAVQLACHALSNGYTATIYTYNLTMFDPTWFQSDSVDISDKLRKQFAIKAGRDPRIRLATAAYLKFLELGGTIRMQPLEGQLIKEHLTSRRPMLAGLSATFLYQQSRERYQPPDANGKTGIEDDLAGEPVGHFVVLSGYDETASRVHISDPLHPNPRAAKQQYWIKLDQVCSAILLGIVTYDSNLLVIEPEVGPLRP